MSTATADVVDAVIICGEDHPELPHVRCGRRAGHRQQPCRGLDPATGEVHDWRSVDDFYLDLHGARERLCRAQTFAKPYHSRVLQGALDSVDAVGSTLPQWSRFDQPPDGGTCTACFGDPPVDHPCRRCGELGEHRIDGDLLSDVIASNCPDWMTGAAARGLADQVLAELAHTEGVTVVRGPDGQPWQPA